MQHTLSSETLLRCGCCGERSRSAIRENAAQALLSVASTTARVLSDEGRQLDEGKAAWSGLLRLFEQLTTSPVRLT